MVRSMKNTLAPINRVPQVVLSLIPDHCETDQELITMTHVCRGWREQFISRSSLWTFLDCTSVDQTRVYLERSKTFPLEIWLGEETRGPFLHDAFLLTVPHLGRLKSLSISGSSNNLVELTKHFLHCRAPLLEKLRIRSTSDDFLTIQGAIFDGDLLSLRELRFSGAFTDLPWRNLSNLMTFDFRQVPGDGISVARFLDFFEGAPVLRTIKLWNVLPGTSDAPRERVVSLPHLKSLDIVAWPTHSILLNRLSIPAGASLVLSFTFGNEKSPIPAYLPSSKNLGHLSRVASINLSHMVTINDPRGEPGVSLRVEGPNGGLYMYGNWDGAPPSSAVAGRQVLHILNHFDISTTRNLTITQCGTSPPPKIENSPAYKTLLRMNALRTLTLTHCLHLPFIFTLDPNRIPSKTVACPELEELVLYVKTKDRFYIKELLEMTKERASRGAGLSTITIVCPQEFVAAREVLRLRDHVSSVEYRLDHVVPKWDDIPNVGGGTGDGTDRDWY